MNSSTIDWRSPRILAAIAAVVVGVAIAAASLFGWFGGGPEPEEYVAPTAIATTETPTPTVTATPTPTPTESETETPTETATEEQVETETATAEAADGIPSVTNVLEPAGSPARVQVHSAAGKSLVDTTLQGARLDGDGILAPPHGVAGWYSEPGWAKPGWPGASIVAGHVRRGQTPDVFWNIPQAVPGDIVTVTYDSGQHAQFRVTRSEAMHKTEVPQDDSIWDHASPTPKLALITCDPATPLRSDGHLEGNWVLWAVPVS